MLIPFEKVGAGDRALGGKAWGLAMLAGAGFPVPAGAVLDSEPGGGAEWQEILQWWRSVGSPPLAVRSSAAAEDGGETSFAGQNRTFLNVHTEEALRRAIGDCFASYHRENSRAYRQFFQREPGGKMNVVLQAMVVAKYSGVFFSEDPVRAGGGWMLEVIAGLGEDLVSGKVNPGRLREGAGEEALPAGFSAKMGAEVARIGLNVKAQLGFSLDMEWAFDASGHFFVLQARPITARAEISSDEFCAKELARLKSCHVPQTVWDGQTFAEWSGLPTPLTLSLWQAAFSPGHAFGNCLKELGYRSFSAAEAKAGGSVLESIFGRAYVNLEKLTELYFGHIPYRVVLRPRPHTVFDASRIDLRCFWQLPAAAWSMVRVGWNLSTKRKQYFQRCLEELALFKHRFVRPVEGSGLAEQPIAAISSQLAAEAEEFATRTLFWPLVLVVLLEFTTQNLRQLLVGILGEKEADQRLRDWTGRGIRTVTLEMQREFALASESPAKRSEFMARYGQRGPGEMDLSHPRWQELGEAAFVVGTKVRPIEDHDAEIEAEIRALPSYKREIVLEEWRWMRRLLETREAWKMDLLRPYAWIRILVGELGERLGMGPAIHYLRLEELLRGERAPKEILLTLAAERERQAKAFRKLSLPDCLSLRELDALLAGGSGEESFSQLDGEPLASGIAFGEVRFVLDPLLEDLSTWPKDVILAAESTDPAWTALFARAKGVVVERGGVLSHCAILSREMGLAAVGGVLGLPKKLKNGDRVWIDGNHGRVIRESN